MARVAFRAARDHDAKRYAPNSFSRARKYFRKGEKAFQERYYDDANEAFKKSRYYAEKAENIARVKMFTQGDMIP